MKLNSYDDAIREQFNNRGAKTSEIPLNHNKINGIILPPNVDKERYDALWQFQTRPDDVFMVTYPKSGTFWLAHIVHNIAKPKGSGQEYIIGGTTPMFDFATPQQLDEYSSPRYMLTHLPYKMLPKDGKHQLKYIYIARNPRDVAVSFFHFISGLKKYDWEGTWNEFIELFLAGNVPYGSWFEHIGGWWDQRNQENMLFIKYEDLKGNLKGKIKIIAEFLGFTISEQEAEKIAEECTFESMKAKPETNPDYRVQLFKPGKKFMRKGIVGDWKNYFTEPQLEALDKLYELHLGNTGLEFEDTSPTHKN